jgi:hypothetical protein
MLAADYRVSECRVSIFCSIADSRDATPNILQRTISTPRDTRLARLEFGTFYKAVCNPTSNEVESFFLWERHLAAMIVAGSHSHKGDTSLPIRTAQRVVTRFLRAHHRS